MRSQEVEVVSLGVLFEEREISRFLDQAFSSHTTELSLRGFISFPNPQEGERDNEPD